MTQPTLTRAQARANGLLTYFTGKPCSHAHNSPRYVSSGQCVMCANRHSHLTETPPGVEFPAMRISEAHASQMWALIDYLRSSEGLPLIPRPGAPLEPPTEWEIFVQSKLRHAGKLGIMPLETMLETAAGLGIPETYGAGRSRPIGDWVFQYEQTPRWARDAARRRRDGDINFLGTPPAVESTVPIVTPTTPAEARAEANAAWERNRAKIENFIKFGKPA